MKKLNWNTILAIVGAVCELAPDLTGLAAWLTSLHVGWLTHVAHGIGILALLMASLPQIIARLRGPLALLGLATPPGAQAPWNPARDAGVIPNAQMRGPEAAHPLETTPRDPQKGGVGTLLLIAGVMLAIFGAWVALAFAFPARASAADISPQAGGCFLSGRACAGPSAAITVASFNLATSQFSGGVAPGLGYGVTYAPDEWYAAGVDIYASLRLGQGQPNQATFSLMGHFAHYVFLGIGPSITQRDSGQPALVQWSVLGGLGVPLGGSTSYVQSRIRAAQDASNPATACATKSASEQTTAERYADKYHAAMAIGAFEEACAAALTVLSFSSEELNLWQARADNACNHGRAQ